MISWGISANSHDAAIAVFADKKLVFASHSERYSGVKNDRDLCKELVAAAKQFGYPDKIYWYEKPFKKTLRQFFAGQGWKGRDNDIEIYMARYEINAPIEYVDHHHSHAAAGYYTSGFDNACVVVVDAIGEFETFTIWEGQGTKLKKRFSKSYPYSMGLFYSAMTQRVGLKPNEDEYILMGMAAYGDANKHIGRIYEDFFKGHYNSFKMKRNLHRGCMDWAPDLIIKDSFDIAAAVQRIYEEWLDDILVKARLLVDSDNLVLMGGCALNCSANRLTGDYYNKTWIMPNPGDAGSSIGAVLAKNPKWRMAQDEFTPFLGYNMDSRTSNKEIVDYLVANKICGLARGRAEFGPRALGNRSLLADPRGVDIKDKINGIKQRQEFRPFAPAILEELTDMYFDMPAGWNNSRYMQVISNCKYPELFPAIVHHDGTSRVQTVPKDGSGIRELLEKWYVLTDCPMLLNTSLNIRGEPMVNDRNDADRFEKLYGVKVLS
jgi:carbamoyltransferase